MSKPEFIANIILAILYSLVLLLYIAVTVIVNKKTDKIDKHINLMLLCLELAAFCKSYLFTH